MVAHLFWVQGVTGSNPVSPTTFRRVMMKRLQKSVNEIVDALFSNGMTPAQHFGIDVKKIAEVEKKHPEIAKQYPRLSA